MSYHCADCEALAARLQGWSSLQSFMHTSLHTCIQNDLDPVPILRHMQMSRYEAQWAFRQAGKDLPPNVGAYFDEVELDQLIGEGKAKESKRL